MGKVQSDFRVMLTRLKNGTWSTNIRGVRKLKAIWYVRNSKIRFRGDSLVSKVSWVEVNWLVCSCCWAVHIERLEGSATPTHPSEGRICQKAGTPVAHTWQIGSLRLIGFLLFYSSMFFPPLPTLFFVVAWSRCEKRHTAGHVGLQRSVWWGRNERARAVSVMPRLSIIRRDSNLSCHLWVHNLSPKQHIVYDFINGQAASWCVFWLTRLGWGNISLRDWSSYCLGGIISKLVKCVEGKNDARKLLI